MSESHELDLAAAHRHFAADCFNRAWSLIDQSTRTPEEAWELVSLGHASLWHWTQRADCSEQNMSVGHWLLSRIYSVLGDPEPARRYAESCLAISQRAGLEPFYLGFAYEAVARAAAVAGDTATAVSALAAARALAENVEGSDDLALLLADLAEVERFDRG